MLLHNPGLKGKLTLPLTTYPNSCFQTGVIGLWTLTSVFSGTPWRKTLILELPWFTNNQRQSMCRIHVQTHPILTGMYVCRLLVLGLGLRLVKSTLSLVTLFFAMCMSPLSMPVCSLVSSRSLIPALMSSFAPQTSFSSSVQPKIIEYYSRNDNPFAQQAPKSNHQQNQLSM